MLTQEKLKKLLHYNPDTGAFTWLVTRRGNRGVGSPAGCLTRLNYVYITLFGKGHRAHRLAWLYMTGNWPKNHIDHKNRVKYDNRWENLRLVTVQQNKCNVEPYHDRKYKGVGQYRKNNRWRSSATYNKKTTHLGVFDCEHEAALVYNQFAMKHYGEYARFNQVYNHFDVEVGRDD